MKKRATKMMKLACSALAIGFAAVASSSYAGPGPQPLQHIISADQISALKTAARS
jgi:hypothetical protein